MIEQQGEVVAVAASRALVRLGGKAGCSACDAGRGCGAGLFGRMLRRRPVVLSFDNDLQALPGQSVIVGLREAWFLTLVTRFYLFPIVAGLVGGAIGHYVSGELLLEASATDGLTLLAAVLAGAIALWRNRHWSMAFTGSSGVHLLRVLPGQEPDDYQEVVS